MRYRRFSIYYSRFAHFIIDGNRLKGSQNMKLLRNDNVIYDSISIFYNVVPTCLPARQAVLVFLCYFFYHNIATTWLSCLLIIFKKSAP